MNRPGLRDEEEEEEEGGELGLNLDETMRSFTLF